MLPENSVLLARYDGAYPEHFRLSPSSSSRWVKCPGSAVEHPPQRTNPAAEAGTVAHEIAAAALQGEAVPDDYSMAEAVKLYVSFVEGLGGGLHVESQLASRRCFDFGGSIDALVVTSDCLHVVDLKTGKLAVAAADNTQLLSYLVLADEMFPGRSEFWGSIVQPFAGGIKTANFSRDELERHCKLVIKASVSDRLEAGPHCRWCPLRSTCFEYHQGVA